MKTKQKITTVHEHPLHVPVSKKNPIDLSRPLLESNLKLLVVNLKNKKICENYLSAAS